MATRRSEDLTPDLFAAASSGAPANKDGKAVDRAKAEPTAPRRYLLPSDLAGALTQLDDREIDALLIAVSDEVKRRGRWPRMEATNLATHHLKADQHGDKEAATPRRATAATSRSRPSTGGDGTPSLPSGKASAVRAAFKVGMKPAAIARQFAISQAAVRQVLAAESPGRKS